MPPKKQLVRNGAAGAALPGIKHVPRPFGSSDSESDSPSVPRLSQTILGPHNSLKQLLSGPPPVAATTPKKRGRKPKVRAPELPLDPAQTPMSRLKRATAWLELPLHAERPVEFDDIAPPQKRPAQPAAPAPPKKRPREANGLAPPKKRGRPRKKPAPDAPATTKIIVPAAQSRKPAKAKAKALQPRPKLLQTPPLPPLGVLLPRRTPRRANASVFDDSDSYVELASQFMLDLAPANPAPGTAARRSSYSNRGKRMLSVGNGFEAKPHSEVPEKEYYKALDPDMPEPSRMRQLLVWCFRKQLERDRDMGAGSNTAHGISKIIEKELLADLVDGAISTSWYSRGNAFDTPVQGKRIVRPNPLNEANKESLEVFLRKLRQLERDSVTWQRAYERSVEPLALLAVKAQNPAPGALAAYLDKKGSRDMVEEVLAEKTTLRIDQCHDAVHTAVATELAPAVDRLHHVLHRMKQAVGLVERLGRERLSSQVAHVVRGYMDRAQTVSDVPLRTKELLRGILRLDAPAKR